MNTSTVTNGKILLIPWLLLSAVRKKVHNEEDKLRHYRKCRNIRLDNDQKFRLLALEMDFWRSCDSSIRHRIPNSVIGDKLGIKRTIVYTINSINSWRWYGHLIDNERKSLAKKEFTTISQKKDANETCLENAEYRIKGQAWLLRGLTRWRLDGLEIMAFGYRGYELKVVITPYNMRNLY